MRAVTLDYQTRRLHQRDVPEPTITSPTQVLFRVLEAGVCGTDRELANFRFGAPPKGEQFLILGHEALGEVIATGGAVTTLKSGDLVVPTVRRACAPACASCGRNRRDLCVTGNYTERGILLAHGYFRGPEAFRQELRSGHLTLLLQQMATVPADPDGCSEFERILVGDLELIQKHAQRVAGKSQDRRLQSRAFFVQCHLLTGGLLSRAKGFLQLLKQLHDRTRQA